MKRVINHMSVTELVGCFEMRKDYYLFDKEEILKPSRVFYERYIDCIFNDKALEFIHAIVVKGYKSDERISYNVVKQGEVLTAIYNFYHNTLPYKGKTYEQWNKLAKTDKEISKKLIKFWNYQLYFQNFFMEEGDLKDNE